jgi:hypothetical protein
MTRPAARQATTRAGTLKEGYRRQDQEGSAEELAGRVMVKKGLIICNN